MDRRHWDGIYAGSSYKRLSWYQETPRRSLALIRKTGLGAEASLIDVGGGTSNLIGELHGRGFRDLWLLDISAQALAMARERLGAAARDVHLLEADVGRADLPEARFDIWHDRAVFHFLTDPVERDRYVATALRAVKPGGYLVMATFAEDGPERCSGLPVERYDARRLAAAFDSGADLQDSVSETHLTPSGTRQHFRYCLLRRWR